MTKVKITIKGGMVQDIEAEGPSIVQVVDLDLEESEQVSTFEFEGDGMVVLVSYPGGIL